MKKIITLFLSVLILSSCLNNDDEIAYNFEFLPIDEFTTPTAFTLGQTDTITIKYSLPNSCYSFRSIYYEYEDTTRIIAVNTFVDLLNSNCETDLDQKEYKIPILASQTEDYLFKFWKGIDDNGENVFEEVVVPVN